MKNPIKKRKEGNKYYTGKEVSKDNSTFIEKNDYYLFDPSIDYIILMLPEELFFYIGQKVVICFTILITIFVALFHLLSKIQSHLEATHSP